MAYNIKLITETKSGKLVKVPAVIEIENGRILFLESPFSLKDEIKAMAGAKWHGYEDPPRQMWSISDCERNRFQLSYLMGENPYEWWDRPLAQHEYERPLRSYQKELADHALTYHYCIWAAEMGLGKTLSAIEVIEKSGVGPWLWVGPKVAIQAVQREFKKWDLSREVEVKTYDGLVSWIDSQPTDIPIGVIFDESSRLKTPGRQRTNAAQVLADCIRAKYGKDGYVIQMSGTPSPKTPLDWWSQCEIAWPGFLREGSKKAFEQRLAFMVRRELYTGNVVDQRVTWKDNELKCATCGSLRDSEVHEPDSNEFHPFKQSTNEVAALADRLKGLVVVKHKKDCLDLPEKQYRRIICEPSKSLLRVAKTIADTAPNAMQALTLLRELSDGFQYREESTGKVICGHCHGLTTVEQWVDPDDEDRKYDSIDMLRPEVVEKLQKREATCPNCGGSGEVPNKVRVTRNIPTPKEEALLNILEELDDVGRLVVFAGFTGSVDRCVEIALKQRWDVIRCDGRGFHIFKIQSDGEQQVVKGVNALDYWANMDNQRVAFVAHPESGGQGLTLTEAPCAVFWSNSFKPEYRVQAEDRIHRPGMDENRGATIIDLIHLPSDERVLDVVRENRRLELLTLGEITEIFETV